MDAIIKQVVQEEINRHSNMQAQRSVSETSTSQLQSNNSNSQPNQATSRPARTATRLSNLLGRIRNGSKGKPNKRVCKEHRLQVRWLHYNVCKKIFLPVKQKNGGGKRFVQYTDLEPLSLEALKDKGAALFFPDGKNNFAGKLEEMHVVVCDATETALFEFPGGGTVEEYLNSNGLYPSSTHFYIRTQVKEHTFQEFESDGVHSDSQSSDTRPFVSAEQSAQSEQNSLHPARLVCEICHCTFASGQSCIRCEQNNEYYASLAADSAPSHEQSENVVEASEEQNLVDIEQLRDHRLSYILGNSNPSNADNSDNPDHDVLEEPPESPPVPTQKLLKVNRTHIKTDLIKHFKDPSILHSDLVFEIINEFGNVEKGAGIGVAREVYTLFWTEFAISMTIGERERVPFVRHDHFIEEWEAIACILVKGYISVCYFPLFISKAFICFCLFSNEVTDAVFFSSFKRYLSQLEEDLVAGILSSNDLPADEGEFQDFLERFNCRSLVKKDNVIKVLLEIAKQELVQKPHLMVGAWQPILQKWLKPYEQFQSISAVEELYESLTPTTKKVLDSLVCNPTTDGERDAVKFLQRFIRGLDMAKLVQFLQFTTAMDIMGREKLQVAFIKSEGFSSRPIAHTCGPLLEIPSTYNNFVELREEFTNILNHGKWELDIV